MIGQYLSLLTNNQNQYLYLLQQARILSQAVQDLDQGKIFAIVTLQHKEAPAVAEPRDVHLDTWEKKHFLWIMVIETLWIVIVIETL
jgi:hypothetical protein